MISGLSNGRKAFTAACACSAQNKDICTVAENAAARKNDGTAKKGSVA
jgi:hypothetical protein